MRNSILLVVCITSMLYACNYSDDIKDYKEGVPDGSPINTILVSPSSFTLYVDSEFPTMSYVCVPANTADSTVSWESDTPDVLDIDSETGELKWGATVKNCEVVISAVSTTNPDVKGECKFSVKNTMGVYQYLDLRAQLGLFVMDRNIGASMVFDETTIGGEESLKGNYYHWGYNAPVINREFGGDDGRGGKYTYPDGRQLIGGYPEFDRYWNAEGENFSDWSQNGETPCPSGWRLPTKEECERMAYMTNVDNFKTQQEKTLARALRKKLSFAETGYYQWEGGKWEGGTAYLWTSTWDPITKKVWVLKIENARGRGDYPWKLEEMELKGRALTIRCVPPGQFP